MKTIKFLSALCLSAALCAGFTSCKSEDTVATDDEVVATTSQEASASALSDEIVSEADQYVTTTAFLTGYQAVAAAQAVTTLPVVTVSKKDSTSFPKTLTIDFGTGFTGKRGRVLKGQMIVVVSGPMWKANSSRTITFNNFYVDNNKVTGSKVLTFNGLNTAKNPSWTVTVKDTVTLATDGTKVIWNSERTRERITNLTDSVKYSITGSSNGVNAKGVAYTMNITSPLIIYANYPHFVQGTVAISTQKRTAILDYGNGTKDNQATMTIGTTTKVITLK